MPSGPAESPCALDRKFALRPLSFHGTAEHTLQHSTQPQASHQSLLSLMYLSERHTISQKYKDLLVWVNCNSTPAVWHNCTDAPITAKAATVQRSIAVAGHRPNALCPDLSLELTTLTVTRPSTDLCHITRYWYSRYLRG